MRLSRASCQQLVEWLGGQGEWLDSSDWSKPIKGVYIFRSVAEGRIEMQQDHDVVKQLLRRVRTHRVPSVCDMWWEQGPEAPSPIGRYRIRKCRTGVSNGYVRYLCLTNGQPHRGPRQLYRTTSSLNIPTPWSSAIPYRGCKRTKYKTKVQYLYEAFA
jgi:hypothetical protein